VNAQIEAQFCTLCAICMTCFMRPRLLPLKAGAESHVTVDKGSVAYRRFLQQQGITFGVC